MADQRFCSQCAEVPAGPGVGVVSNWSLLGNFRHGSLAATSDRSAAAQAKASGQRDPGGEPYRSFRGLLEHLTTLTRNQVRFTGTRATVPMLAEPTGAQRKAFHLIGVPVPLTLK